MSPRSTCAGRDGAPIVVRPRWFSFSPNAIWGWCQGHCHSIVHPCYWKLTWPRLQWHGPRDHGRPLPVLLARMQHRAQPQVQRGEGSGWHEGFQRYGWSTKGWRLFDTDRMTQSSRTNMVSQVTVAWFKDPRSSVSQVRRYVAGVLAALDMGARPPPKSEDYPGAMPTSFPTTAGIGFAGAWNSCRFRNGPELSRTIS